MSTYSKQPSLSNSQPNLGAGSSGLNGHSSEVRVNGRGFGGEKTSDPGGNNPPSCHKSYSVPNQLDSFAEVPGTESESSARSFMKKHLRSSNLKLVLKTPWKSLKNLRLDKLTRWRNNYDLSGGGGSSSFSAENPFWVKPDSSSKPVSFRRLGFGRLTHWRNRYDLTDAAQEFQSMSLNSVESYKFLEIRSMPDNRVVDSSSEYLDAVQELQDQESDVDPPSTAYTETEV